MLRGSVCHERPSSLPSNNADVLTQPRLRLRYADVSDVCKLNFRVPNVDPDSCYRQPSWQNKHLFVACCHIWLARLFLWSQHRFVVCHGFHLSRVSYSHFSNHLSVCEREPLKRLLVRVWLAVLIGSRKVTAPTHSFEDVGVRDRWEQQSEKWRALLLGQLPTAETGYGMLNLTVECVTMDVCVCVCVFIFRPNGKKQEPRWAAALFEYPRVNPTSATHTCHLYLVSDPHAQSLALAQMWTRSHWRMCTLRHNTEVFVHSASPVCGNESRFDLHESVNFEVENGFCPG